MFSSEARDFDLVENYRGPGRVWVPETSWEPGNDEDMRYKDVKKNIYNILESCFYLYHSISILGFQ